MNTDPTISVFPEDIYAKSASVLEALRTHDDFIISGHAFADGDAAGSVGAMGCLLGMMGKRFALYNEKGTPDFLSWLPQPGTVYSDINALPFTPRTAVLLDCGDAARAGEALAAMLPPNENALPCINIDHHRGNPQFGTLANWVEPDFAATAQIVAYLAHAAGMPLRGMIAENIGLGMLTDTGFFAHGNTTPQVMALMTHMMTEGLDISELREQLSKQSSLNKMRLWGHLLQNIDMYRDETIAAAAVSESLFAATGTGREDMEGFIDMLRTVRGVKAAVVVRENAGLCKFSFRSSGAVDVRAAAERLGGGGHTNAAGGTLAVPLETAYPKIIQAVHNELDAEDAAERA